MDDRTTQPNDATQPAAGDYAQLTAFLVEDSVIIAMDTEDTLLELGVGNVVTEATVAGALERLATETPDLVLLDYNLGQETGDAVAAELKRRGIAFWLATGDVELESRCADLGARGLLIKPYGKRELVDMLSEFARLN